MPDTFEVSVFPDDVEEHALVVVIEVSQAIAEPQEAVANTDPEILVDGAVNDHQHAAAVAPIQVVPASC